jgi:hypothetical protein
MLANLSWNFGRIIPLSGDIKHADLYKDYKLYTVCLYIQVNMKEAKVFWFIKTSTTQIKIITPSLFLRMNNFLHVKHHTTDKYYIL